MKKYIVAGVLVAGIAAYLIFTNSNATPIASNTPPTGAGATSAPSETVNPGSAIGGGSSASTDTGSSNGSSASGYKDGSYTGPVTDAVYGQIQVAVTIAGGKIASVDVPVYPSAPGHTSEVTAFAIPRLKQEAIAAQSANVDIVSGATQDSEAFQQSLAAALAQAKS